jgi:hypothetical protein
MLMLTFILACIIIGLTIGVLTALAEADLRSTLDTSDIGLVPRAPSPGEPDFGDSIPPWTRFPPHH